MDHKAQLTKMLHNLINGNTDEAEAQLRQCMIEKGLGITSPGAVQESEDEHDEHGRKHGHDDIDHEPEQHKGAHFKLVPTSVEDVEIGDEIKDGDEIKTVGKRDLKPGEDGVTLFDTMHKLGDKSVYKVIYQTM